MIRNLLLLGALLSPDQATSQSTASAAAKPTACTQALASGASGAAAEICLGEEEVRRGDAAAKGRAERSRRFDSAVEHYRKADNLAAGAEARARALDAIAGLYDAQHLNDPVRMEGALWELIGLKPNDLTPVFRLAKLQEDRGLLEAAEETWLAAHRQKPDSIEPYRMLAQFYARRATAMHQVTETQKQPSPTSGPGERDENGVYRVGGAIAMPQRLDRPVYPPEAAAAGIQGVVIAEVVVNESGDVADAKVVRSIPLLDDEALRSVRNWHYTPTVVNGQPVPVRMTVTVNFTTR